MHEQRGSSRTSSPDVGAEDYVVYVTGLPPTHSWKELKDFGRRVVPYERIRRAEVYTRSNGESLCFGYITVKSEADGRRLYHYASDPLQSGGPYTAILAKATTPSVPVIGSWSSGLFTRLDTPTVRAGVQPSGPAAVASVPPVPSGYYDNYLLGDTTATSSAITHVNNLEAYYYYQTCVNNACYLANRASAYAAYESSRGNAELAHAHWHEAQTQWTSQVFYQGGAYVAGNRMLQDEAWMRETGSPTSILSALPSSSLVSSYNPVSESGFPQQPPMALRNMSSSLVAKPLYHIQYVPEAIPTSLPTVHTNGDGTPVNVSHGALPIESRGVFIQNLHYEASSFHISNLLQQAGAVERCTVNARGTATATFRTAEEANMAVCLFDGAVFMGRTIRVRLDREVNPVTY